VSTKTGRRAWTFATHRCTAASPALDRGTVFASFLNRGACNQSRSGLDGEVVALAVGNGKPRWVTKIGPTESSPLVALGRVYVGDWRGKVYALDKHTGRIRWSFQTGDKVKGGVALSGNRLFVGSYDGHLYALNALTGRLIWRASAQPRLGSVATFYSTPAVAYGRVYIGATDGKVYSFGATSGKLRWSHGTGGYVYSSPAVWNRRVYAGSYDHTFYCFDAATGDVRWSFHANGPISGSPTIIDGIVYFATLAQRTYALNAVTGKQLWTFPDGKYSPVVADQKRLYLVGYARVYGMVPKR
jgi:outer membrane protein assembly factor BamB